MEAKVEKTEEEWQQQLTPEEYEVMRRHGTEPPFTGKYVHSKEDGIYRCAACGNELFSSSAKFDSGTGWPSFTEPAIADAIETRDDSSYGMVRTEVLCTALRLAPRPRLPRRPRSDRPALVHQLAVAEAGPGRWLLT